MSVRSNRDQLTRRQWCVRAALALGGALVPSSLRAFSIPKRILVVGGTRFVGPAIVEQLLAMGHSVTLFNRGITAPDMFKNIERLRGFRDPDPTQENYSALGQRRWDVVVDVWPSDPAIAANAARALRDRADHYIYISSIAAYDVTVFARPHATESAPLRAWDEQRRDYNRGKAESERRIAGVVPADQLTIVRAGPIKGYRDDGADLFTWLRRAQRPGPHIGPGSGNDAVQLVDVRDIARLVGLVVDRRAIGSYNATGPATPFRSFLSACARAGGEDDRTVWIPSDVLATHGLRATAAGPRGQFPFWRPEPHLTGFYQISSDRALAMGWARRPFEETALDTLAWFAGVDPGFASFTDDLPAERERQVLDAWSRRSP